jgi:hypothetical protein
MGFIHLKIERNPWLGGYCPQIPDLSALYPQLNLLNPHEKSSWVCHWNLLFLFKTYALSSCRLVQRNFMNYNGVS